MKLGEALNKRAELGKEIARLGSMIPGALTYVVKPDGSPLDDEQAIIPEVIPAYEKAQNDLENLIRQINQTNAQTQVDGSGLTITGLIAKRERAGEQAKFFSSIAQTIQRNQSYGGSRYGGGVQAAFGGISALEFAKGKKDGVDKDSIKAAQDEINAEQARLDAQANKVKEVVTYKQVLTKVDHFAKIVREADAKLQEVNWTTDLL